jgi:D-serine deaminase-like pyridoxal phosphate-dependent protein
MAARTLHDVDTPCLVLERGRLKRNLERMAQAVARRGVALRAHLKTVKAIEIARLAAPDPAAPIAVSTLREAEYFFEHGYRDIFYAVGIGPGKLRRAAGLVRAGAGLITMVDSLEAAKAIRAAEKQFGVTLRTVIEIDSGEHRGGVAVRPGSRVPIAPARGRSCAGIATHAGQTYGTRTPDELNAVAAEEANVAREAGAMLRAEGMPPGIVSIGSSPAGFADADLGGVTEFRVGVYMFWDLFQEGIGACGPQDLALSVLGEIIGRPEGRAEFLIDAGAFALSKDISTAALRPEQDAGYGLVCDLDGRVIPGLKVGRVWQEHGLVVSDRPLVAGTFQIGERVRILPNHACPTAAAHDRYQVVDGGREVLGEWSRVNGW